MPLAPLFQASMRSANSDVMLCSNASLSDGGAIYPNSVEGRASQSELVEMIYNPLSKRGVVPKCKWRYFHSTNGITRNTSVCWRAFPSLWECVDWPGKCRSFLPMSQQWSIRKYYITWFQTVGRDPRVCGDLVKNVWALCLAFLLQLVPIWLPSKTSPHDAPSRNIRLSCLQFEDANPTWIQISVTAIQYLLRTKKLGNLGIGKFDSVLCEYIQQ